MYSSSFKKPDWLLLTLSFVVAVAMWYGVTVYDTLEVQFEIPLDYQGLPSNLVIVDGLVNKVSARIRGPKTLLRSMTSRDFNSTVDLSKIKKGLNVVPTAPNINEVAARAFSLMEITPARITLEADTIANRSIALDPQILSPLPKNAVVINDIAVSPATVQIRGPESVVNPMSTLPLNITLDPLLTAGTHIQTVHLDLPPLVTAVPSSVRVAFTSTSHRKEISLEREVLVDNAARRGYHVNPQKVSIRVEIPEALAQNNDYLQKIRVLAAPPRISGDLITTAPVKMELPPGVKVIDGPPPSVTVTKTGK